MRMGEFYTNEDTGTLSAIFLETYKKDFFTNIAGPVPAPGLLVRMKIVRY